MEVVEGELVNLRGKVVSVEGSQITVKPDHEDLAENLKFEADDLRKFFSAGDHVKVSQSTEDM